MMRAMRSQRSPVRRASLVSLLALGLSLAVRVHAAMAQGAGSPPLWSMQVHGGMFAPIGGNGASPMVGMRYCKHYTPQFYGGVLTAWSMKSSSLEQPAADPADPRVELARVNAQLVPVMGFIQVRLTNRLVVPILGIGAGYEWLKFDVVDHRTGVESHPTYGNWSWETWGGLAIRLNNIWRLNGEVYYNGGSLERHFNDASGRDQIEVVHMNGVGVRIGPDMDFW